MLHTHDDFLNAIVAAPSDRTLRLVFADWLDEHSDPRAELIRIEEEMRTLPVFSDRFWELKSRRNALRTLAGAEWCGQMRYGTECEPVFRHGIPDGWRERWRLIREFTERWHRVPMGDVGGRQKEIAEVERRLGRELPPSMRELVAYDCDTQQHEGGFLIWHGTFEVTPVPGQPAVSLFGDSPGNKYGYLHAHCTHPDPPVDRYIWDGELGIHTDYALAGDLHESSVTRFIFWLLLRSCIGPYHRANEFLSNPRDQDRLLGNLEDHFPVFARWENLELYEMDNVVFTLQNQQEGLVVIGWIADHISNSALPSFLRQFIEREDGSIPF